MVFDFPVVSWDDNREAYGELRISLLGWLGGRVVHMTYTERGEDLHVISLRKAKKYEIRRYQRALSRPGLTKGSSWALASPRHLARVLCLGLDNFRVGFFSVESVLYHRDFPLGD